MARPISSGLPYFSHDTNSAEDKLKYVFSECRITDSYTIYFMLLELIYQINGYYILWNEREENIFISDKLKKEISKDEFKKILNVLIKEKLFNGDLFNKYRILTSAGIQKRYLAGCIRRTEIKLIQEYLLVDITNKRYVTYKDKFIVYDIGEKEVILKKKININVFNDIDFEKLFDLYPRKEGKTNGYKILYDIIDSKDMYNSIKNSIVNYSKKVKDEERETKYIKTFDKFFKDGIYNDFFVVEEESKNSKSPYKNAKEVLRKDK